MSSTSTPKANPKALMSTALISRSTIEGAFWRAMTLSLSTCSVVGDVFGKVHRPRADIASSKARDLEPSLRENVMVTAYKFDPCRECELYKFHICGSFFAGS